MDNSELARDYISDLLEFYTNLRLKRKRRSERRENTQSARIRQLEDYVAFSCVLSLTKWNLHMAIGCISYIH